jgi:hypothetical protein
MPVFFFDIHSGNELSIDDEGMELRDVLAAQVEAACHSACNIDPLSRGIGVQN